MYLTHSYIINTLNHFALTVFLLILKRKSFFNQLSLKLLKFHSFTLHMPLLIFKIFVSYKLIIKHLPYLYSLKNLFHILTKISNWKSTLLIWQLTVPHKNKNQFSNPLKYNSSLLLSGSCIIP